MLACTGSLKVALKVVATPMSVAPEAGVVRETFGGPGSVMNSQITGNGIAMPELFLAPLTMAM